MARKVLFINFLLLAGIAALGYHLVVSWEQFESTQNLARILERAEQSVGEPELEPLASVATTRPIPNYLAVSEHDLFRPERRPPAAEPEVQVEAQPPQFAKRPQMTGAAVVGNLRKAYLVVFDTPKAEGDLKVVSVGDSVAGYTVEQITDTTVTLAWRDVREVIDMFDSEAAPPARTVAQRTASLNIIKIGSRYAAVETSSPEGAEANVASAQTPGQVVGASSSRRSLGRDRLGGRSIQRGSTTAEAAPGPSGIIGVPRSPAPAPPTSEGAGPQ